LAGGERIAGGKWVNTHGRDLFCETG